VDFGQISTRTLYAESKSQPKAFVIELKDCSTDVFNSVTVTFSGTENANMSDRLAITPVAPNRQRYWHGFEESNGTAISLNTPTTAVAISDATMQLNLKLLLKGNRTP
jgi:type 1 fimbria pilin